MNDVHPSFAPFLASIAPPEQRDAIAADLDYNDDKAHRLNNDAFIASMQKQINDKTGEIK